MERGMTAEERDRKQSNEVRSKGTRVVGMKLGHTHQRESCLNRSGGDTPPSVDGLRQRENEAGNKRLGICL